MSYDNTNRGVLFINTRKEPGSKHPDFTGSLDVNGEKFDMAGWNNTSSKGTDYISVTIKEPYEKKQSSSDEEAPF